MRWFLLGWSVFSLFFLLAPFLFVTIASVGSGEFVEFPPRGLTLRWYAEIKAEFVRSFGLSLALAVVSAGVSMMLGIPAALGLVRGRFGGKAAVHALLRAPLQVPLLVVGVGFLQFYRLGEDLGGPRLTGTFLGLTAAHVCLTLPYTISAVSTALARTNLHLEEAAHSLGASRWSTLRRVTLPAIRPGIYAGLFFAFITSFENVPVSLFLVGSGMVTLPMMIFEEVQFAFGPSIMALSTLVVLFSTGLILGVQRLTGLHLGPAEGEE